MQLPLFATSKSFINTETWHIQSKDKSLRPAGTFQTNATGQTCWQFSLTYTHVSSHTHAHTQTHARTNTVGVCNKLTMLHLLQVADAFAQTTRSLRPNIWSTLVPLSLKFIGTIQGWCRQRLEKSLPLSRAHCFYMKYAEHGRQRQSHNRKQKVTRIRKKSFS